MLTSVQVRLILVVGTLCAIAYCTSDRTVHAGPNDCSLGCWSQGPTDFIAYFTGTEPVPCVLYTDKTDSSSHCSADKAYSAKLD